MTELSPEAWGNRYRNIRGITAYLQDGGRRDIIARMVTESGGQIVVPAEAAQGEPNGRLARSARGVPAGRGTRCWGGR
jgi:hypothetical protein